MKTSSTPSGALHGPKAPNMNGLLSQSLANAEASESTIQNVTGLPPAAQAIQADSVALIGTMVSAGRNLQKAVSSFVNSAESFLTQAGNDLKGSAPLASVLQQVETVQKEADTLKSTADSTADQATAANSKFDGYVGRLSSIESTLNGRKKTLQAQLDVYRAREAAVQRRINYLRTLGPIGDLLAAALALQREIQRMSSNTEAELSGLQLQLSRQEMLIAATKQLESDFIGLAHKVSGVANTLDFVVSDLGEIASVLGQSGASRTVVQLLVTATLTEVETLAQDAA